MVKCDRCHKYIPDTQMYPPVQIGFQFEPRRLCRSCIDDYKKVMIPFWSKYEPTLPKKYPNRELIGSFIEPIFPLPLNNPEPLIERITQNTAEPEPKKPNAIARLFYWLFYTEVKQE
jgi:hypothetical protein